MTAPLFPSPALMEIFSMRGTLYSWRVIFRHEPNVVHSGDAATYAGAMAAINLAMERVSVSQAVAEEKKVA